MDSPAPRFRRFFYWNDMNCGEIRPLEQLFKPRLKLALAGVMGVQLAAISGNFIKSPAPVFAIENARKNNVEFPPDFLDFPVERSGNLVKSGILFSTAVQVPLTFASQFVMFLVMGIGLDGVSVHDQSWVFDRKYDKNVWFFNSKYGKKKKWNLPWSPRHFHVQEMDH